MVSKECFLNELKSNYYCYKSFIYNSFIETYDILHHISRGLLAIHNENFIHRDLHSGNILVNKNDHIYKYAVGDLGLSQPANDTLSNNEIYGVIPYIAPEIFKGSTFSKKSDIYSLGMIMWELTTEDTPKLYSNLMKSEKPHPKAIYTSRPISSYISKCSSIFSKCSSVNSSNDYTSIEVVLDIDIESKSKLLGTKRKIEELLNDNSYENNGKPKTLKLVPGFPH
ncbi:unnamed protein product [Rhizophagus irregularis]|nr:unnamed protein product [Rhizophagus irregularis]